MNKGINFRIKALLLHILMISMLTSGIGALFFSDRSYVYAEDTYEKTGYLCIADDLKEKMKFGPNSTYEGSNVQTWCTTQYMNISEADKKRIVGVKTREDPTSRYVPSINDLCGCNIDGTRTGSDAGKDKLFILSGKEYVDNKSKTGWTGNTPYWLRSRYNYGNDRVGMVLYESVGYSLLFPQGGGSATEPVYYACPAAYLDTSLFQYKNSDGKWVLDGNGTASSDEVQAGDKVYFADHTWTILNNKKIKPDGTESSSSSEGKQEREAPSEPNAYASGTTITIRNASNEMEYLIVTKGTSAYDWTSPLLLENGKTDITNSGLQPLTDYTVVARYAENETYYASPVSTKDVKTGKAPQDAPSGSISFTVTDTSVSVDLPKQDQEYILLEKNAELTEESWENAVSGETVSFDGLSPATDYDVYTRKMADATHDPSPASAKYTATTDKSMQDKPISLETRKASSSTDNKGAVTNLDKAKMYQYSSDQNTWIDIPVNSEEISLSPGTYYIRFAGDSTHFPSPASDALKITAKGVQNKPAGITVTNASNALSNDGALHGVNASMEYSLDTGSKWTAANSGNISNLAPGKVLVRMAETADLEASDANEYIIGNKEEIDHAKALSDLRAKIEEAERKLNNGKTYTNSTRISLENEINVAKELLSDDNATTVQLNGEISNLDEDIQGLIEKADQDAPVSPEIAEKTSSSIKIDPSVVGVQYILMGKGQDPDFGDWEDISKTKTSHDGEAISFTGLDPETEYDIYARKAETPDKLASDPIKVTVKTNRIGPKAPEGLSAVRASGDAANDGKITGLDSDIAYEYSTDGGENWSDVSGTSDITGLGKGHVRVRIKAETDQDNGASVTLEIGVKGEQAAPEGLMPVNASNAASSDGKITGLSQDKNYQYSLDSGENWAAVTAGLTEITGLGPGEVLVRYAGTGEENPGEAVKLVIGNNDQIAADKVKALIDALPQPGDVTSEDREDIEAARRAYSALTDDQKRYIDEDTLKHLTDDEEALLIRAKEDAKEDLRRYRNSKNDSDYSADGITELDTAKENGEKTIDAADSIDAVLEALDNAKKAIDAVKTKESSGRGGGGITPAEDTDLATAKDAAKAELQKYRDAKDNASYDDAGIAALDKAVNDGKLAIDQAADVDAVKKALDAAKAAVDSVKTKEPEDRSRQMGEDGTALGRGASWEAAEAAILGMTSDADPAGSKIMPLKAKSIKQTKKSVKLQWSKPSGAVEYVIYGNKCGKKNKMKRLKTTTKAKINFKKVAGKKVKKNTSYKFIVVALDKDNNVVSTSKVVHAVSKSTKKCNPTKLKIKSPKKLKKTLKAGQTFMIKSKVSKVKGKKVYLHVAKSYKGLRYESSNPAVAKVSKTGKVTAVSAGTAKVIVYAQNGKYKTISVSVK